MSFQYQDHPGGELAILTFAGKDATEEFNMIHPPDVIGNLQHVIVQHYYCILNMTLHIKNETHNCLNKL